MSDFVLEKVIVAAISLTLVCSIAETATATERNPSTKGDITRRIPYDQHQRSNQATEPLTDEELMALPRDARRTRIIEGFQCDYTHYGQTAYMKYLSGGMGLAGNHEGENVFRWKVANDQFCLSGTYFEDKCYDLPKVDMPDERDWLLAALSRGCL